MYSATEPSLVTRVAFLAATDTPFLRRTTTACSKSPFASVRACLQSIMGAPVFSRSSFTCAAEIFTVVVLINSSFVIVVQQNADANNVLINFNPRSLRSRGPDTSGAKAPIYALYSARAEVVPFPVY